MMDCYDTAVVGGGPAGAAAALTLANSGLRVLLLDGSDPGEFKIGESLVPVARNLLSELEIDEQELQHHAPCYGIERSWGSSAVSRTDFIHSPYGCGWHLNRPQFDALLQRKAEARGVTLLQGSRLAQARRHRHLWELRVSRTNALPAPIRCRWLLDCSGRNGRLARFFPVRRTFYDRLVAVFARLEGDGSFADTSTFVESAPGGWWYAALLPGGNWVVAFLTDAGLPEGLQARRSGEFMNLLAQTSLIRGVWGAAEPRLIHGPRVVDARTSRLDRFWGPGWVAAGDAAISMDPLSSQGILTALYSGVRAGRFLALHLNGDEQALPQYEGELNGIFEIYLQRRTEFYSMERRWAAKPFWAARQGGPA